MCSRDVLRRVLVCNGYTVRHVVNITDVGHLTSDADEGEDKMEKGQPAHRRIGRGPSRNATPRHTSRTGARSTCWSRRYGAARRTTSRSRSPSLPSSSGRAMCIGPTTASISTPASRTATAFSRGWTAPACRRASGVAVGAKRSPRISRYGSSVLATSTGRWNGQALGAAVSLAGISNARRCRPNISEPGSIFIAAARTISPCTTATEIAQTEAAHGTRHANFWMHGHFLTLGASKMAKSSGDFFRLQTLIDRHIDPLAYRYLCLCAHYRGELRFNWHRLTPRRRP